MKTTMLLTLALLGTAAFAETYKIDPAASRVEWKAGKKSAHSTTAISR